LLASVPSSVFAQRGDYFTNPQTSSATAIFALNDEYLDAQVTKEHDFVLGASDKNDSSAQALDEQASPRAGDQQVHQTN
jgi:hypothetical protein